MKSDRSIILENALPWLLPVGLLIVWELVVRMGWVSARLMPPPTTVALSFWGLLRSGEFTHHLGISLQRALTGFAIGGGLGLVLGFLTGISRISFKVLDSTIQMIRNIPHLAFIPIVILWFGIGETSKVFLIALGSIFPIYVNTTHGIRSVDRQLIEMGSVYGLDRRGLLREVIIPGAMPSILNGVRLGLGFMWLTLIVAETIATTTGVGYLAMNAREFMMTDVVLVAILLYAILGKLSDFLTRRLERTMLAWHPSYAAF